MSEKAKQSYYLGSWSQSITRREMIFGMGGVITLGGLGLLASCSNDGSGGSEGALGGALVGVMTQQIPSSLDPIINAQGAAISAAGPCHDWLEYVAINGDLYPSLAESVEQPDPQTIIYTIHSGVKFQNGESVNAQAVADLVGWIQNKNNGAWLNSRFEGVKAVVVDELTLRLELPKPDVAFRFAVTRLPIVAVSTLADQALTPSGCGPYLFKEWVQGSYIEYTKDPNYREADKIDLDSVRMEHFNDSNAGTQAFLAGGKNWVYPTSLSQSKDLSARAKAGEIGYMPLEPGVCYLINNCKSGPTANPLVRKAIRLALDRQAMVDGPFNGLSRPFFSMLKPESSFYVKELEYKRDIDQAKALMAEAGMADGFSEKIYTPNVDYFIGLSTIMKENLAAINIDITVEIEETAAVIDRMFSRKEFNMVVLGDALSPDVSELHEYYLRSTGGRNCGFYSNDKVDALLDEGLSEVDAKKSYEIYKQVQMTSLLEDTGFIPLVAEVLPAAFKGTNYAEFMGGFIQYIIWPEAALD
jgi:ABC-type transport system substrate-binding protein